MPLCPWRALLGGHHRPGGENPPDGQVRRQVLVKRLVAALHGPLGRGRPSPPSSGSLGGRWTSGQRIAGKSHPTRRTSFRFGPERGSGPELVNVPAESQGCGQKPRARKQVGFLRKPSSGIASVAFSGPFQRSAPGTARIRRVAVCAPVLVIIHARCCFFVRADAIMPPAVSDKSRCYFRPMPRRRQPSPRQPSPTRRNCSSKSPRR